MIKTTLLLILVTSAFGLNGQSILYFQDSPDNAFYDFSWMELILPANWSGRGMNSGSSRWNRSSPRSRESIHSG